MSPLELFLSVALTGLGTYAGWVTKAFIAHLISDQQYDRETSHRGVEAAEKVVKVAEDKAG